MKTRSTKILAAVALVAILAVAGYAFAGWGWNPMGYGPHHGPMRGAYNGYGPGQGAYGTGYGPGPGYGLSQEQLEALAQQRQAFFNDTASLRQNLFEKQAALRNELAKENPDVEAARKLQAEISDLRGQFDQKRLEHQMKVAETVPEAGRGFRGPRGGYGYGHGHGRGYGYGPGACWR